MSSISEFPPPLRVCIFGTHPYQYNGYSKVVYELAKNVHRLQDAQNIKLFVFGFQNFYGKQPDHRNDLPDEVPVYDAFQSEGSHGPGFGVSKVKEYVALCKPDLCVVYNDVMIIREIVTQLAEIPNRTFKIVTYLDQVYLCQRKAYVEFINKNVDAAILFTKYWRECILGQSLKMPTFVMEHGFNPREFYPVPQKIARKYYGVPPDAFVVLNLNRNQPRKRWDICLMAFAEVLAQRRGTRAKLAIATSLTGSWDLLEVYERELAKREIPMQEGMNHLILIETPQRLSDFDTNILYNVADIGINTCDGEGFGLCQAEQAGIGIPQVVPKLGGFLDFFDDSCAVMVEPAVHYYVDHSRDMVGGEAQMCNYKDFAKGILKYLDDPALRLKHGRAARRKILDSPKYDWAKLADRFSKICNIVCQRQLKEQHNNTNHKDASFENRARTYSCKDDIIIVDVADSGLDVQEKNAKYLSKMKQLPVDLNALD